MNQKEKAKCTKVYYKNQYKISGSYNINTKPKSCKARRKSKYYQYAHLG